ncbi:AMP-binding protein [Rhodococcus sp. BP-252]|uniref:ATP-dependent acyl-CoA ligase n=1 Tax=unclassified Rhodococcus (in: high G+C Gram-positive bacteria) TaxID=192944 RepID=UPI001C9AB19A|nr:MULTISPECIES: ATP-dependent acyl-CoA ligase [unclassified Rhodococcus (in: high G+C Gram-positive bacteria)]MBY6414395.1 AMP-binding protein [Rhodococcus sp. BP-320]MBY6419532.1 AMP-binding protein [Rhodococcus sp. BP-321]MBY6424027.1 AMP-binding protein [Rhodococcus sp. BP-324]MBY6429238.1 AMP-binding protein [Rhodococcus sp. BP-323]MBY6434197.1 AMP-binding protein [Rhodococcus sp. BP-322]
MQSTIDRIAPLRGLPMKECTIPALLTRQAELYGDKTLLKIGNAALTYAEVRDLAAATAGVLQANGIRRGDTVATLSENRLELIQTILGCAWIGAVAVPLNAALQGTQLRHALENSNSKILVIESDLLARLQSVSAPSHLEQVWTLDSTDAGVAGYDVRPFPTPAGTVPACPVAPGDTAALLYTSGTTGVSKGVCCPHAQFYWWGITVTEQLGITEEDTLFTVLPLFHTNALNAFVQTLVAGATIVVGRRFSASRFWSQLNDSGATVTYLLGAMINILWSRESEPVERRHTVRCALSPATPAALAEPFFDRFGIRLVDGFGSTETNSVLTSAPDLPRPGYIGHVQPDFEAVVVDEHDSPVADGTPGELLLRSRVPYAFATGYYGMHDKTTEAWRNLWFHTGDRVVREPDGWFRFVDRMKDVIRRRGENISSFEVEQVIGSHPAVETVAAYPVPSEMAEDEVMVSIVPKTGAVLSPRDVVDHCSSRLAKFAVPRFVDIVETLPTTENGKIRKVLLRERGRTTTTWDRDALN